MSKKITATIVGACASLSGVLLWILISFIGFIAGIAGAVMGIAFLLAYKRINQEDDSKYPHIAAGIIIIIDIIIAELIAITIIAAPYDVALSEAMQIPEIQNAVILDVVVGLLLSYVCYFSYLISQKRKKNNEKAMAEYNYSLSQMVESQQIAVDSDEYKEAVSVTRKITILREKKFYASLTKISYICDGAFVGVAKNGETVTFNVDGRQHSLCATMGMSKGSAMSQSPAMLIEAGNEDKTYKIKIKMRMNTVDLWLENC